MKCWFCLLVSYLRGPLYESGEDRWIPVARFVFACAFTVYSRQDKPSRLLPSSLLVSRGSGMHAVGNPSRRVGLTYFWPMAQSLRAGQPLDLANQNRERERTRLTFRVSHPRELGQLLYADRQRAEALPSPEKNSTLTFSVDYKGNWKTRAAVTGHY